MWIVGGIEDNINKLVWSQISNRFFSITNESKLSGFQTYKDLFFGFTHPWLNNQPVEALVSSVILTIFGLQGYNLLLLMTVLLNLFFSYRFFRRYQFGYIYALLFSFSTYFWIHLGVHLDLMQLWVIPWILTDLINLNFTSTKKEIIKLGVKISFVTLISNYLGFILISTLGLYSLSLLLVRRIKVMQLFWVLLSPIIILFVILFPYIKTNYFDQSHSVNLTEMRTVSRPIEDFVTFSTRPWYFIIPPTKNLIFGFGSTFIYDKLASTNHYLLDDYFPKEDAACYFGIPLLALFIYVFLKMNKRKYLPELITLVGLFLLSLPPFFTVHGFKIYLPGSLTFYLLPMFRVGARFSLVILFLILFLLAENLRFNSKKTYIFVFLFTLITLLDTYIPVKLTDISKHSEVYDYLRTQTNEASYFAVYPYSLAQEALLNVPVHKRYFVNPRNYFYYGFDSEKFTSTLDKRPALYVLRSMHVRYLIVDKQSPSAGYFASTINFAKLKETPDRILYEILY